MVSYIPVASRMQKIFMDSVVPLKSLKDAYLRLQNMLRQCLFFGQFEGFDAYKLDAYKKRVYSEIHLVVTKFVEHFS